MSGPVDDLKSGVRSLVEASPAARILSATAKVGDRAIEAYDGIKRTIKRKMSSGPYGKGRAVSKGR